MPEAAANLPPPRAWSLRQGDGVEGLLAHEDVDHTILDPPYDESVEAGNEAVEVRDNSFGFDPMNEELRNRTARTIATRTRRWALVFCSLEEAHLWRFALISAGMSYWRTGVWVRQNSAPQFDARGPAQVLEAIVLAHSRHMTQRWNGGGKHAMWVAPIVQGDSRIHPTQKPALLMQQLITDFTDEGEIIADPFAGSGTTGVAAVGLGRRFVGWELDKDHYAAALKRIDNTPLLDHSTMEQMDLLTGAPPRRKGAAAKARMELERRVVQSLLAVGDEGVQVGNLGELLDVPDQEILRCLNKLKKSGRVSRKGRTNQTRWYAHTQEKQS